VTAAIDAVSSPNYGSLPGVFVHAAAFDNLVTWGKESYQDRLPFDLPPARYDVTLIVLLSIVLFASRWIVRAAAGAGVLANACGGVFNVTVAFSAGLALALVEAVFFRTSPENWILAPTIVSVTAVILHRSTLWLCTLRFWRWCRCCWSRFRTLLHRGPWKK
jgi:hypothetical protein